MKQELKPKQKNNILKCKHFGMQVKMFSASLFGIKKVFPLGGNYSCRSPQFAQNNSLEKFLLTTLAVYKEMFL